MEPIYLKDYKAPDFLISEILLYFRLHPEATKVQSTLSVRRNPDAGSGKPLILNGEKLKLHSILMNGRKLGSGDYAVDERFLILPNVPDAFSLEIETEINPRANQALEGLYESGKMLCTQNESEGFRKITYYPDRPDVMAKFTTTLEADKKQYPILLANGNPVSSGSLPNGRHFVRWADPFPKPCYLFALVAGDLGEVRDSFTTRSKRKIDLRMYVDKGNEKKCGYAMGALKRAMKWDEDTFGLECDLDTYMIVAVDAFNFGAMENKGLNIFNSQYILADPKTATDSNFEAIESVIGHEYFHNWTGNRVTCRDWFQITLKEGLTIFRDQEFSSDMGSRACCRISDVRMLKENQFVEDAGPQSHPIRPPFYIQVNNFYTSTVYQKGAEVIRMIETMIGTDNFRKGMAKYFELFDGQAVTTDDFVHAMEIASGWDLLQFKNWYSQSGTPVCRVETQFDQAAGRYALTVRQFPPKNAKGSYEPFVFPFRLGLLGADGKDLALTVTGREGDKPETTKTLIISKTEEVFHFDQIQKRPVASLLRNFSAPVHLEYDLPDNDLIFLLSHDSDAFNRFDAGQRLALKCMREMMAADRTKKNYKLPAAITAAFGKVMEGGIDASFKAEILTMPGMAVLTEEMETCDFDAAHKAREGFLWQLAQQHEAKLQTLYAENRDAGEFRFDAESVGKRKLKNRALAYLTLIGRAEYTQWAEDQLEQATNMTDEIAALELLCQIDCPERERAIGRFYKKWKKNQLVMNKWFAVQAGSRLGDTLDRVRLLEKDPAFDIKNPNKIRVLYGVFSHNLLRFHDVSGKGYEFIAEKVIEINAFNPSAAAHLSGCFNKFNKVDSKRKSLMGKQLERILNATKLSSHVFEIVSKILKPDSPLTR